MSLAAVKIGLLDSESAHKIKQTCELYNLPTTTDKSVDELMEYISLDKKKSGDTISIVLPKAIGEVEIRSVTFEELKELLCLGLERTS